MARPLRIQYPGAFYHITSRGNERGVIFASNKDREKFLSCLELAAQRYAALFHAYCLMDNHYHLLLETQEANLSEILHHINTSYTVYFNKAKKRSGHLFQGRYKAIVVEKDAYATELSRYIHLNPARAGMREKLLDPLYTSFPAYIKTQERLMWLKADFILSYFGKTERGKVKRYRVYVYEGLEKNLESPLKDTVALAVLGSDSFVRWVRQGLAQEKENRDLPALRELRLRPTIDQIKKEVDIVFGKRTKEARRVALYLCHRYSGRPLSEIASAFGAIGLSAISQNTRRINEGHLEDRKLKEAMKRVEKMMTK